MAAVPRVAVRTAAVEMLEPPMLDADRLEQRLDGKLVVRLAGDGLADQRGMIEPERRIAALVPGSNASWAVSGSPSWPETCRHGPWFLAPLASGVIPEVWFRSCLTVICALRGSLSGWARDEVERRIVERHLPRRRPAGSAPSDRQHRRADGLGDRRDPAGIGLGAVAALDFQHDVPVANDDGGKIPFVALQQPLLQFVQLLRVHAPDPADVLRAVQRPPTAGRLRRREIIRGLVASAFVGSRSSPADSLIRRLRSSTRPVCPGRPR